MKIWWLIGIMISLSLITISCGTEESNSGGYDSEKVEAEEPAPDISGYVMDQDENNILVVTPMPDESTQNGRAMWVSEAPKGLWIGKQVEVWVDGGIAESYPEQAKAEKVKELEMSEVEGADLKASEALSNALSKTKEEDVLAVKLLAFDEQSDQWTVKLYQQGAENGDIKTTVKDQK